MKQLNGTYLFLIFVLAISGCMPNETTIKPTLTLIQLPSPTLIPSTFTPTPQPTQSLTLTPPATLEPEQAENTIKTLLRDPVDCKAPCFWGITPGQTTLDESKNSLAYLGLQIKSTTYQGKDFYGIRYDFHSGLSVMVTLTVQEELVENLRVDITPETQRAGIPREWSAYSPETLIKQYGTPSRVDFFLGEIGPPTYSMQMYFKEVDLIIQYINFDHVVFESGQTHVCPLLDQYNSVRVWLGEDPQYPPGAAVPLEEATSMTRDEFASLMMGNPDSACFNLKKEMFP